MNQPKTLNYILTPNNIPITLNLYEAERYAPAVIVQQLIGNLVYYSNHGRYEPRISESWERVSPTQWDFKIKSGYTCENGEVITARSFK
jgi:MarR-like DNA-binding transcriptional regulator SgrR of sgrS sRNA